jgi:hypothetical protein
MQATRQGEDVSKKALLEGSRIVAPDRDADAIATRTIIGELPAERAVSHFYIASHKRKPLSILELIEQFTVLTRRS